MPPKSARKTKSLSPPVLKQPPSTEGTALKQDAMTTGDLLDSPTNPWKVVGKSDSTGTNAPKGILKKQDATPMQTVTKQDLTSVASGSTNPKSSAQTAETPQDADGDGLGTQWMKGLYESSPFSPQGSAIHFLSRDSADDSQTHSTPEGTPGDQDDSTKNATSPTSHHGLPARPNQDD